MPNLTIDLQRMQRDVLIKQSVLMPADVGSPGQTGYIPAHSGEIPGVNTPGLATPTEEAKRIDPLVLPHPYNLMMEELRRLLANGIPTYELAFRSWRVDQVTLNAATAVWLDDINQGRFMQHRRAVAIVNDDAAISVAIRQIENGTVLGGTIGPGRNISFPCGSLCKFYAISAAAGTPTVSFYQFS